MGRKKSSQMKNVYEDLMKKVAELTKEAIEEMRRIARDGEPKV